MKKENGVTLMVLVFTMIVLLIIMGISFSVMTGDNGMMKRSADASFKYKMSQIKELVDEKTSLFQLEEVDETEGNKLLNKNARMEILQEFYNAYNPKESRLNLLYENDEVENELVVHLYYDAAAFTTDEIRVIEKCGGIRMTGRETFETDENK